MLDSFSLLLRLKQEKKTALSLSLLATSPHYIPTPAHATTFLEKRKSCSPIIDFEVHFTLIFKLVTAYLSTFPLAISLDQMVQTIR